MRQRITWRSPLVVMLAFATMIGLGGLIYAHWFSEATIDGNVNTGGVSVMWVNGWTNDDGVDNGEGEGGGPAGGFDYWGDESSADPSADGRYDKDVGRCFVQEGFGGDFLGVQLENVYPSYHCTFTGELQGSEGVPAMSAGFSIDPSEFQLQTGWERRNGTPYEGPVCWDQGDPDDPEDDRNLAVTSDEFVGDEGECTDLSQVRFEVVPVFEPLVFNWSRYEVRVKRGSGERLLTITADPADICGDQIDPEGGETGTFAATVHVGQGADQNSGFQFRIHPRFVNWNEYDESLCRLVLTGDPPQTD